MIDDLERLITDRERPITAMAREAAHHQQGSLATATRQIRDLVAVAREE